MTMKQSDLLKRLEMRNNVTWICKKLNWEEELAFDKETGIYRTTKEGWFRYSLEYLIKVATGKEEGIELK